MKKFIDLSKIFLFSRLFLISCILFSINAESYANSTKKVNIEQLRPSQTRISLIDIEDKINKIKIGYSGRKIQDSVYISPHPIKVIQFLNKNNKSYYHLIDGHHEVLAAKRLGAKKIMVSVVDKVRNLDSILKYNRSCFPAEDLLNLRFYLWSYDSLGKFYWNQNMMSLDELDSSVNDDINRSFIGKTMVVKLEDGSTIDPQGKALPLWVKDCRHTLPPFAEFMLADVLRSNGFIASAEDYKDQSRVMQAHKILWEAKQGVESFNLHKHPFNWSGFQLNWLYLVHSSE
ncbi:putative ParB-like nuclease (plasmid) [Candidatus Megaera polyxenophila]|nr:putative ParB-like nuclease [Candidatus Megaera polyxenophila]